MCPFSHAHRNLFAQEVSHLYYELDQTLISIKEDDVLQRASFFSHACMQFRCSLFSHHKNLLSFSYLLFLFLLIDDINRQVLKYTSHIIKRQENISKMMNTLFQHLGTSHSQKSNTSSEKPSSGSPLFSPTITNRLEYRKSNHSTRNV